MVNWRSMRVWIALGAALVLASACTSKASRYRVLRFFFDGVPDPNAPVLEERAENSQLGRSDKVKKPRRVVFAHAPWGEGRCRDCHNPDTGMLHQTLEEGLCQSCHAEIPGYVAYVHGPVAVNDCLACHEVHESEYPSLLLDDPKLICRRCHEETDLITGPDHESIGEVACLECHDPHGGSDQFLLRQRAP